MDRHILRCYLVAGTQDCRHLPDYAHSPQTALLSRLEEALRAGVTCYQFREKGQFALTDEAQIERLARDCQNLCRQYGVPFVVNNEVRLAEKLHADGIHVGQTDCPVEELAKRLPKTMIGLSVNTLEQARRHDGFAPVSYFGCGPIFATQSKSDASPVVGIDFIRTLRQNGIAKPIVAIGGIQAAHAAPLRQAGADGVAVISAIMQSENVAQTVEAICKI